MAVGWRKIEAVLIELLKEEGFDVEQVRGESFITTFISLDGALARDAIQICIGDFAKELEKRL
jgi:hypothetical protein